MKESVNTTSSNQRNTEVRVTNQEKVREIIEQYIDKFDMEILCNGFVFHPVFNVCFWKFEPGFPNEDSVLEIMDQPHGLQKLNDMAKSAIKKYLREYSLTDIFESTKFPYYFKILKEAKAYLSTDEFSHLLRVAWEKDKFAYYSGAGINCTEILELLKSCNPQAFMTADEWEYFQHDLHSQEIFYRAKDTDGPEAFVWAAIKGPDRYSESPDYGGYTAYIDKENIFAVVHNYPFGFIVNPYKLQSIEYVEDDWEGYNDE